MLWGRGGAKNVDRRATIPFPPYIFNTHFVILQNVFSRSEGSGLKYRPMPASDMTVVCTGLDLFGKAEPARNNNLDSSAWFTG